MKINILERQRSDLLRAIASIYPMIPGSFKEVYRKCGKSNCWCQSSASGHPFKRITWKEHGESCTKAVDDEDVEWVKQATGNHKKFREMVASLVELEIGIHEILKEHAAAIIDKARSEKTFVRNAVLQSHRRNRLQK